MNNDNTNSSLPFLGGAIIVCGLGYAVLKALEALFHQAEATLNAFIPFAHKAFVVSAYAGSAAFCVVSAVYFTLKYVGLVRKATDLRQYVESRLDDFLVEFKKTTEAEFNETANWLRRDVRIMEQRLEEALKPATATPTPATVTTNADAAETGLPEATESPDAENEEIDEYKDLDPTDDDALAESQPY